MYLMLWYGILFHVMQKQQLYSNNNYWPLVFVAGVQCIILDFRNKPCNILKVLQCFNKPCSFHLQNTFSSPIFLIMRSVEPVLSHFPNHEVPGTLSSTLFLNHLVFSNWIISHSSISSSYTLLATALTFLLKMKITLLTKTLKQFQHTLLVTPKSQSCTVVIILYFLYYKLTIIYIASPCILWMHLYMKCIS